MKICFLAGANSAHSHRWIGYFAERGYEIHWISLMPSIETISKKISFYDIGPLSTSPINVSIQALKARNLIKKIKPDILHVHSAGTYGLIGALTGFHPLAITVWGSDVLLSTGIKKKLVKFVLTKADLLTCDGDNTTSALINFGVRPEKIHRNYWGVDILKFKPMPPDADLKKEFFDLKSPIVISLRSLEPIYDIQSLIKSVPLVLKEMPDTKFIIAGDGSQRKYLQEIVISLDISKAVKFIGYVSSQQLPNYFNIADVYVSTSLSDSGLAASTAEAMACGLPVIITDFCDNKKWVKNGENGFVVPLSNSEILAEKIVFLLKNRPLRKLFGECNVKIIEEKNNYYKEMKKMEELYEKIATLC